MIPEGKATYLLPCVIAKVLQDVSQKCQEQQMTVEISICRNCQAFTKSQEYGSALIWRMAPEPISFGCIRGRVELGQLNEPCIMQSSQCICSGQKGHFGSWGRSVEVPCKIFRWRHQVKGTMRSDVVVDLLPLAHGLVQFLEFQPSHVELMTLFGVHPLGPFDMPVGLG